MSGAERFLRLAETYRSLQGEGVHSGLPCTFVRTAGCDLRCTWCDTPHALEGSSGRWWSRSEVLAGISPQTRLVQITGGEPLLQREAVYELSRDLVARGHRVLLETGGHLPLGQVPEGVHVVMDIKLPGSGESRHDFVANLPGLRPTDEVKFVVANESDFRFARALIEEQDLADRFCVLVSPAWGLFDPAGLARLVLDSGLAIRMQLQAHKYVWGPEAVGV